MITPMIKYEIVKVFEKNYKSLCQVIFKFYDNLTKKFFHISRNLLSLKNSNDACEVLNSI